MKRLAKHDPITIHLSDLITSIDHIVICENVLRRPYLITASSDSDFDEMTEEQFLVTMSDEELAKLPESKLHLFTNIELLGRIAKIDYDLLSLEQKELLRSNYSAKVVISKEDVEAILSMIQQCKSVSYEGQHWKTNKFLQYKNGEFRKQDCLDILKQLTIEDYVANSRSYNISHIGNHIIVFEPDSDWELDDGTVLSNIKIYVKLDIDESDGSAIALISMHQAAYSDDVYPYRK